MGDVPSLTCSHFAKVYVPLNFPQFRRWRHTQSIAVDVHFVSFPSASSLLYGCILSGVDDRVVFLHIEKFSSLAEVPYPHTYKRFLRTLDVFNFGERDTERSAYTLH